MHVFVSVQLNSKRQMKMVHTAYSFVDLPIGLIDDKPEALFC